MLHPMMEGILFQVHPQFRKFYSIYFNEIISFTSKNDFNGCLKEDERQVRAVPKSPKTIQVNLGAKQIASTFVEMPLGTG